MLKRTFKDRRRERRQLVNTTVQVFTGSSHLSALGINLSDVGMCLFAIANLPLGSQIELEFLPPWSNEPTRVRGSIRHRALYLYGVEFVEESEPQSAGWADLAARHRP